MSSQLQNTLCALNPSIRINERMEEQQSELMATGPYDFVGSEFEVCKEELLEMGAVSYSYRNHF